MTTTIKNLKVGDRLPDEELSEYGHFIEISIHSIRITKGGRFVIEVKYTYEDKHGIKSEPVIRTYSNGALSGNTPIEII